jgi:predicted CopG family antitoxin
MDITTIQLSNEMKTKLGTFGSKGESYEIILRRIYDLAVKEQLRQFLMSSEGCISLEDFEKEVEKKWPKSK